MRVLFCINGLGRGGAEHSFVNDSAELVRRGHDVHVCILYGACGDYPLANSLDPAITRHALRARSLWDVGAFRRLRRIVTQNAYDVVYTTLNDANMFTRFALVGLSSRLVRREANLLAKKPRWQRVFDVLFDWRTHAIIAVSQQIASELARLMLWKRGSVHVLPNAVALGERADVTHEPPIGVCVGSLTPKKNHAVLVEAFIRARAAGLNARLDIIGEGTERPKLESLIAAHHAAEHVRLVGELPHAEVQVAYAHAQFFALPSLWEGSPNVLLEAMAHGLPALVSDIPSMREIAGEYAALYMSPTSVEDWVRGLQKIADSSLRASMGLSAYERVAQKFDPMRRFDKLELLLRG